MFGKKHSPQAPSSINQDATEALPGAQRAVQLLREAMREYPPIYRTDEYHALQQVLMEMTADLEELAGGKGAHRA